MPSRSVTKAARRVRAANERHASRNHRHARYAEVVDIDPLRCVLEDADWTLDADDDLVLTQWVKAYDADEGIGVGDTLLVRRMRNGDWLVDDVISEESAEFSIPGGSGSSDGTGGGGGGTVADASTTVKGVSKLSVAPASATNPIAVGTNDPRMTDARTPTAHTHDDRYYTETEMDAALAAKQDAATAATDAELSAHVNDTSDAHDASAISFTPTGSISSNDVQAAIAEVAAEAGGTQTKAFAFFMG